MINNRKYNIVSIFVILVFFVQPVFGQLDLVSSQQIDFTNAVTTLKTGNWSDPAIWSSGEIPSASTDVIINDNHTVYIDKQGTVSGEIVDLCRNLQIKTKAVLQMGHNTPDFDKDLRLNGSLLCNGTFSSGRNQPGASGDGLIYAYNSRVHLNLSKDETYISGWGYFNPKTINVSSDAGERNLIIDLYNMVVDNDFVIESNNRIHTTISHYAYVRIKGVLGLTGSTYQLSSSLAKADLMIQGIVVTDDLSLFTKNKKSGESSSITIANQGSLYTQKINNNELNKKTETAGFELIINTGGLLRLGKGIDFENLKLENSYFSINNSGDIRRHYSETLSDKITITNSINQYNPSNENVIDVSKIKDVFGATHIAGWYNFTDKPYLIEGLDKYKDFGATSIKTNISTLNGRMESSYPFNHNWPSFQTLKDVAQYKMLDSLFKRTHIKTHTFWTTTKNAQNYKKGPDFDHDSYLDEEEQFYDVTKYLLETYGSTDKTFVYQNWEGDWMLRGLGVNWENNPSLIPDNLNWSIEGMARVFRARQRGTERARGEFLNANAKVFHCIEFNKLWMPSGDRITMMENGTPCVVANVVPLTRVDLTSWSAYDAGWQNNDNPHGHAMWKGLEMARYFTTETGDLESDFPVQIGEFAINENPPYNGANTESLIQERYDSYIGVALGLGIPNFYLWNLYCTGQKGPANGFTWEKGVQYEEDFLYEWMDGKWLLEPDGAWGVAASYLMSLWEDTLSTNTAFDHKTEVKLFPNPTSERFVVTGIDENYTITFFDLNNKELKKISYKKGGIDVEGLKKGVYLILINRIGNSKKILKKVVIK